MNASELQHILSRLYTDAAYRSDFLNGKEAFYKLYAIQSPETIAFLDALKPKQLEFFSKGLHSKKYHEVLRIIPGTSFLLKKEIGALFKEFTKIPQNYGVHKHHEETLAFIQYIRNNRNPDVELRDVLKFEEVLILNFINPKKWRISVFKYDVLEFLRALQAGQNPAIRKKRSLAIFKSGKLMRYYKARF